MLHIKIGQLASEIFMFESVDGRTDDGGPLVYYKLTLWAFRSGELINQNNNSKIISWNSIFEIEY